MLAQITAGRIFVQFNFKLPKGKGFACGFRLTGETGKSFTYRSQPIISITSPTLKLFCVCENTYCYPTKSTSNFLTLTRL